MQNLEICKTSKLSIKICNYINYKFIDLCSELFLCENLSFFINCQVCQVYIFFLYISLYLYILNNVYTYIIL